MISMARCVGRLGYPAANVAEVIAEAGVSRKTFYEHFADKDECFLAAYRQLCEEVVRELAALAKERPAARGKDALVEQQLRNYLEVLSVDVLAARAFVVEVDAAGPKAREVRDEVNDQFADLVFGYLTDDAQVRRAIIGGVNELVGRALNGGSKDVRNLLPMLKRFVLGDW